MPVADITSEKFNTFLAWNKKVPDANMEKFKKLMEKKYNLNIDSYWDLHHWSVMNTENFWDEIWKYLGIISSKPYDKAFVKTGPGILENEWFSEATFNVAENLLKFKDDSIAISYTDVDGNSDSVTFNELFEEVRLYAAALKKNGLKMGDVVACYMSNRKEAVIAMLATLSIGAIWGGAHPFYGANVVLRVMKKLEPKFVIAVDRFSFMGEEKDVLDRLPRAIEGVCSVEKVIIVPTIQETLTRDISHVRKSVFLQEFLETGKLKDGQVPNLVFEQLPANHPIFINFTSGTTGEPKGVVHSAKLLIYLLTLHFLHLNIKRGDTMFSHYQMGWVLWHYMLHCLGLGARLFLFEGFPLHRYKNQDNFWDVVAKSKTTHIFLVPIISEESDSTGLLPSGKYDFESLKMVTIGGSAVKKQNIDFFHKYLSKNAFVANAYGCTETIGFLSGFDWNMPYYAPETQIPALGVDLQCFDSNGKSIVGKRGEVVIVTPLPCLPIYLWRDTGNVILNQTYLSKYPGVWCQSDECYFNPETKAFMPIGRSDDTITQNGKRFLPMDIYIAIQSIPELEDFLCVPQKKQNGHDRAVLFIKLKKGYIFTEDFKKKIENKIEEELWLHLVPQVILPVTDIPYNVNGKKMESIVRKIVKTNTIPDATNIRNPECLKEFCDISEIVNFDKQ